MIIGGSDREGREREGRGGGRGGGGIEEGGEVMIEEQGVKKGVKGENEEVMIIIASVERQQAHKHAHTCTAR